MAEIQRGNHFMSGFGNEDFLEDYFTNRMFRGRPAANFSENDKRYRIEIGIPGLCRDDVEIQVADGQLIISGARREESEPETEQRYSRQEFEQRHFSRNFKLPENGDADAISAHCKDGLLVIDIPKKEKAGYRSIQIR